jgi:molybdopterin synthase sulfur carrier subunit
MIRVLFFASLREQLGTAREELPPMPGAMTVADVAAQLCARGAPWSELLDKGQRIMTAVNQELARPETPVRDGDEVAFFPPVTGG